MTFNFPDAGPRPKVLYHAVSTYQLLEVMAHRLVYHPGAYAALILPDFITRKYPDWRRLVRRRFFDDVCLLPYLHIRHTHAQQIAGEVAQACGRLLPAPVEDFSRIYVAGAHFYFSLYLIRRQLPFTMMEDAAGMLSRPWELYRPLVKKHPLHAELARMHGLLDGRNPCIHRIICLKRAQTFDVSGPRYVDFDLEAVLEALPPRERRRIVHFFLKRRIHTRADAILLTQHLADLGVMTPQEQRQLYIALRDRFLGGRSLIIKPHPDDTLDYARIFPGAQILAKPFPSELLPYALDRKPPDLFTLSSTGSENLKHHFTIYQIGGIPPDD